MMITDSDYRLIYSQAKGNAKVRGIYFGLTRSHFWKVVKRAGGCCQVTGITFSGHKVNGAGRRPYFPSIDRIDSGKGYTSKNVRLVIVAFNLALNEWGIGPLQEIAEALCGDGVQKRIPHDIHDQEIRRLENLLAEKQAAEEQASQIEIQLNRIEAKVNQLLGERVPAGKVERRDIVEIGLRLREAHLKGDQAEIKAARRALRELNRSGNMKS